MWELITLPFRLAWSVLTVAWDIVWGCVSLAFGLVGGIFSLLLGVAVLVLLVALIYVSYFMQFDKIFFKLLLTLAHR